jgi:hypothetical protein
MPPAEYRISNKRPKLEYHRRLATVSEDADDSLIFSFSDEGSLFSFHSFASCSTRCIANGNRREAQRDDVKSVISAWTAAKRVNFVGLFQDIEEEDVEMVLVDDRKDDPTAFLDRVIDVEADDQWRAAKRGDLKALQSFASRDNFDVTLEDDFGCTALYYGCHSGAITAWGLELVLFLLEKWPTAMIPKPILERCRKNAINRDVVRLLDGDKDLIDYVKSRRSTLDRLSMDEDEDSFSGTCLVFERDSADESDY